MDPNRTQLLAQNGMPGEYIVSGPFIARAPRSQPRPHPQENTMKRRESTESLDSIAKEKEEAQTPQASRSGLRSVFSKVARKLSGPEKEKAVDAGEGKVDDVGAHRPFEVYVVGNQVMYLPNSDRRGQ